MVITVWLMDKGRQQGLPPDADRGVVAGEEYVAATLSTSASMLCPHTQTHTNTSISMLCPTDIYIRTDITCTCTHASSQRTYSSIQTPMH